MCIRDRLHTQLHGTIFTSLPPAHCTNAATACSSFATQLIEQLRRLHPSHDLEAAAHTREPSLELAAAWYQAFAEQTGGRPVIMLVLHGIESFTSAPLNDFLHGIALWARSFGGRDTENAVSDVLGVAREPAVLPVVPCIFYTAPALVLPRDQMASNAPMWPTQYLAGSVLELLDVVHCTLPDKVQFWDDVVCEVRVY